LQTQSQLAAELMLLGESGGTALSLNIPVIENLELNQDYLKNVDGLIDSFKDKDGNVRDDRYTMFFR